MRTSASCDGLRCICCFGRCWVSSTSARASPRGWRRTIRPPLVALPGCVAPGSLCMGIADAGGTLARAAISHRAAQLAIAGRAASCPRWCILGLRAGRGKRINSIREEAPAAGGASVMRLLSEAGMWPEAPNHNLLRSTRSSSLPAPPRMHRASAGCGGKRRSRGRGAEGVSASRPPR